jgi:GNAT superfamily N-acetyltransferase
VNIKNKDQYRKDLDEIKKIYDTAWEPMWGFVKPTEEEFEFLAADLKQIADPRYIFFAEVRGKIAGFILCLPDINQALIHNRKGGILGGVYQLLTKSKKIDLLRIVILGVLPEFQGLGIDAAMYHEIGLRGENNGIKAGEASWILEDNAMMNRGLTKIMNGDRYRTYRMYQKSL